MQKNKGVFAWIMGPEFFLNARNYRILYSNKNDNIERGKLTIEETKQLEENP